MAQALTKKEKPQEPDIEIIEERGDLKHWREQGIDFIAFDGKIARAEFPLKLHNEEFALVAALSYRDGMSSARQDWDSMSIEMFCRQAVKEKIARCLQDYARLGELQSRKLQRKYRHYVTLKPKTNGDIADKEYVAYPDAREEHFGFW